jgi:peptide/nickel transport system ATP-binding protein
MIAMAMVCQPKLLIADEPTTALDVTIQAQILSLILRLKSELNMSVLLITHDLGVIAQMASRVVVMYAGQVVEQGRMTDIFDRPFHPYTQGLLKSMPRLRNRKNGHTPRLSEIPGTVPSLMEAVIGCRFADRCPQVFDDCHKQQPDLFRVGDGQRARCWLKCHPDRRKPIA